MADPATALPALIAVDLWRGVGWTAVLFAARLASLDGEVLEAAQIDGAGRFRTMWQVAFPMVKDYVRTLTMLQFLWTLFTSAALILLLTKGGPGTSSTTLSYLVYAKAFSQRDLGYSQVVGVVLLLARNPRDAADQSPVPEGAPMKFRPAHVLSWLYALILAVPLYYLAVSAFKTNIEIFTRPFALPATWLWENLATAWETAKLGQALLNSVLVSGVAIALTLALAVPAAYALARTGNRLARAITGAFSAGFLIPPFAALIPTVVLAIELGLFGTREFQMLFLPPARCRCRCCCSRSSCSPCRPPWRSRPQMEGAGHWVLLTRVYVPIAMPGVVSVAILQLLTFWNEYLFALTITGTAPDVRTVQVALPTLLSDATNLGVLSAGTVLTVLPVYVAYALLEPSYAGSTHRGGGQGMTQTTETTTATRHDLGGVWELTWAGGPGPERMRSRSRPRCRARCTPP